MIHISTDKKQTLPATGCNLADWPQHFEGPGIVATAIVVNQRPHSVTTKADIIRYVAVTVCDVCAHVRKFDKYGMEIDPNNESDNVQVKGYLNVVRKKADDTSLTLEQLTKEFSGGMDTALPKGILNERLQSLHPQVEGHFEVWGSPDMIRDLDLTPGDKIRFRTEGGFILTAAARNDGKLFSKYSGGAVMDEVADKMTAARDDERALPGEELEGVDEDEWSD
eukprot:GCRY01000865.1.p1 GENE.GCRY01000865.1~~GCRY01000865.1.p1  ORF type:complete len:223 (-),score=18.86 GCRY01000865.1:481-1149(-)